MDRFSLMTAFARVAETKSFTKAASSLGLSRATISVAIRDLEAHLGVRLLHRTTRSVNLTPEGQLYYERAHELLAKLEDTEQLFRGRQRQVGGRLVLDVPSRIARRVLIPALPELLARHPELEISLGASDRAVDLIEKGVDAVVRVGPLSDSSLIARPLGMLAQINCASPRYLSRRGRPQGLGDLAKHQLIAYGKAARGDVNFDYLDGAHERSLAMTSMISVDNAETYIAAALAGLGIIQIPAYDVRHHLQSGALIEILAEHSPPPLPIAVLYPSRRQLPARLQLLIPWLTTLFVQHGLFEAPARAGGAIRPTG